MAGDADVGRVGFTEENFYTRPFTVNGQKMSKSLGNVIDPIDMADKFGSDAARYLLLSQFPAFEHGDVKADDFVNKYKRFGQRSRQSAGEVVHNDD